MPWAVGAAVPRSHVDTGGESPQAALWGSILLSLDPRGGSEQLRMPWAVGVVVPSPRVDTGIESPQAALWGSILLSLDPRGGSEQLRMPWAVGVVVPSPRVDTGIESPQAPPRVSMAPSGPRATTYFSYGDCGGEPW